MRIKKVKRAHENLKNSCYDTSDEFFETLKIFHDGRISIATSCHECDNFDSTGKGSCKRYNRWVQDSNGIPEWCKDPKVKDLVELYDKLMEDAYVRAHFEK